MRKFWREAVALLCGLWVLGLPAQSQDLPGARDYPGLARFAGSSIIAHEVRNFDSVDFQTSTYKSWDGQARQRRYAEPPLTLEGKLTRLWYEAPGSTRSLELYRNYSNALEAAGFKPLYDSSKDAAATRWPGFLGSFSSHNKDYVKSSRSEFVFSAAAAQSLRTGTFQKDNTTVRLIVVDWPQDERTFKARAGAYAALDILESQPMQQSMVVLSASEIGKALTASGKVAIYGILFDTGKADIKPDSKPSLEQIAAFLKIEPNARLHVVGHTDTVGQFDANLALSRRRADAVAAALVRDYGIAASRLQANGVASLAPLASNASEAGRAQNRRVELVLQ